MDIVLWLKITDLNNAAILSRFDVLFANYLLVSLRLQMQYKRPIIDMCLANA